MLADSFGIVILLSSARMPYLAMRRFRYRGLRHFSKLNDGPVARISPILIAIRLSDALTTARGSPTVLESSRWPIAA